MKTIETTAMVNAEGKLLIELVSDLPPGTHQVILVIDETLTLPAEPTVKEPKTQSETPKTAWETLRAHAGTVEMPEDWSKEHDHYLYGTAKRES